MVSTKYLRQAAFILIIGIAFVVRIYGLGKIPSSLNWDEVSYGYNAHSIILTGKDEFGTRFPFILRSLDDYKQPVYLYLTILSELIFGYNNFAVRFPSVIAGVLTVGLVYLLIKELYKQNKYGKKQNFSFRIDTVPLVAALILAVQPWNIQFSRMAAEANVGLFFAVLFIYSFIHSLRKPGWMIISACSFGLAVYCYLSTKVYVPLFFVYLVITYRKILWQERKRYLFAAGIFVVIFGMLGYEIFFGGTNLRYRGTNIFSQTDQYKVDEREMYYDAALGINVSRKIFHDNHILTSLKLVARGYLSHFSPEYLFFDTGQKIRPAPRVGLVYFWLAPFIVIGLIYAFQSVPLATRHMLALLFISAIPPAVTGDIPHPIRSFGMSIPLAYFSAFGIYQTGIWLRKRIIIEAFSICIVMLFGLSIWYFSHQYLVHLPHMRSQQWQFGRKEMTDYLFRVHSSYDRVIVSSSLEWPYIFMLYYGKYDPAKYLDQGGTVSGGWGEEGNHFDNFEFHRFTRKQINESAESGENNLYVLLSGETDVSGIPSFDIRNPDGSTAMVIAGKYVVE